MNGITFQNLLGKSTGIFHISGTPSRFGTVKQGFTVSHLAT